VPSGAIYKRAEDGIVLVDQDRCPRLAHVRDRLPVQEGLLQPPHRQGREVHRSASRASRSASRPVCAETCVGRLRYIGIVLYDADRVLEAASVEDEHELLAAQRSVLLDPDDPAVQRRGGGRPGIPADWVTAAQRSPVWALINRFEVALPLHPEYRTMPMVWYIPPLSRSSTAHRDRARRRGPRGACSAPSTPMRIRSSTSPSCSPQGTIPKPVRDVLRRLAAMRSYMRDINLGRDPDERIAAAVGMTGESVYDMFRLLAIAKYEERYVIPTAHAEQAHKLEELATDCSLDYDGGPGMGGWGPFGEGSGGVTPIAVENFHMLKDRQTADSVTGPSGPGRVNLLNWDGKGAPSGLFPSRPDARAVRPRSPPGPIPPARSSPGHEGAAGSAALAADHLAGGFAAARLPGRRDAARAGGGPLLGGGRAAGRGTPAAAAVSSTPRPVRPSRSWPRRTSRRSTCAADAVST
jgi:nitrate reductase beta subunit